ncbi:MAG: hypothetical protein HN428_01185 [Proteobacteria bacterium]|nr:hypothetical protein [Pseudomonadota bacterium]
MSTAFVIRRVIVISASSRACPSCGLGNGVAGAVYRTACYRCGGGLASEEKKQHYTAREYPDGKASLL